jgi:hypothetical protein
MKLSFDFFRAKMKWSIYAENKHAVIHAFLDIAIVAPGLHKWM